MSATVLAAWVLSIAVLLPGFPLAGPGFSRAALVALAWTALAGLPAGPGARGPGERLPGERAHGAILASAGLALAPLAVALALDLAAGHAAADLALTACVASLAFLALGHSALRGGAAHAGAWFVLVAGAPILAAILGWGRAGPAPPLLDAVRAASPLAWCYDRISGAGAPPALPLGTSAALLALAFLGGPWRRA